MRGSSVWYRVKIGKKGLVLLTLLSIILGGKNEENGVYL